VAFDKSLVAERKADIEKKIESLKEQLDIDSILPSLQDTFEMCISHEIEGLRKRVKNYDTEIDQLKEGSPRFAEATKIKQELLDKIKVLENEMVHS
jgi:hypothetical protein